MNNLRPLPMETQEGLLEDLEDFRIIQELNTPVYFQKKVADAIADILIKLFTPPHYDQKKV